MVSEIGYVGLGRMGVNQVENLLDRGFRVVIYDKEPRKVQELVEKRVDEAYQGDLVSVGSLERMVRELSSPRIVWMMVPSGKPVDFVLQSLFPSLSPKDTIIEGGNSYFQDSIRRAQEATNRGLNYLDVGTSGGTQGAREGACLTIGGDQAVYETLMPLFQAMSAPDAYLYVGPSGSGHFVKMVHNLIEYGMEQSLAEGMEMLQAGEKVFGKELDLQKICSNWNQSSIIQSRLVGYLAEALGREAYGPELAHLSSVIGGGETGELALKTAMELQVPLPVSSSALWKRYQSRQEESFGSKCIAAMRNVFGEHAVEYKKTPSRK